jgi:hypothetical protein
MRNRYLLLCVGMAGLLLSCNAATNAGNSGQSGLKEPEPRPVADTAFPVIHILVALCDNRYQGIVPVPAAIGNGQDPDHNLYWGCAYGIRTFFKNSREWKLLRQYRPDTMRMERLVFRHKTKNYFLVADAYDGKYIKTCTTDFLNGCAGKDGDTLNIEGKHIGIKGNARLLCYIGHDGLMDFNLDASFPNQDGKTRDAMILACYSKKYFRNYLQQTGANPLLWSAGLMSPEAYTLHNAINAYVGKEGAEVIRQKAARAYAKYQKCSEKAAMHLLRSGYE